MPETSALNYRTFDYKRIRALATGTGNLRGLDITTKHLNTYLSLSLFQSLSLSLSLSLSRFSVHPLQVAEDNWALEVAQCFPSTPTSLSLSFSNLSDPTAGKPPEAS